MGRPQCMHLAANTPPHKPSPAYSTPEPAFPPTVACTHTRTLTRIHALSPTHLLNFSLCCQCLPHCTQDELSEAVLLVMANKQDLDGSMTGDEVIDALGMHSYRQRTWYVQPICMQPVNDQVFEGVEWLVDTINRKS